MRESFYLNSFGDNVDRKKDWNFQKKVFQEEHISSVTLSEWVKEELTVKKVKILISELFKKKVFKIYFLDFIENCIVGQYVELLVKFFVA